MPSPYSYDLRIRALKMIDEGIPITQVSKLLKISRVIRLPYSGQINYNNPSRRNHNGKASRHQVH
ncbi:hypothetical protein PsalMR5_03579 [Piscirickettsia salmonis]|nr:hypothetical protein PsalSR1_03571 [Piscirickettsia salmonis]QGP58028.1 hypothetical protein PsalBI1_00581 [Piscirickettsia salmonis]QGP65672.1 hypothetical protein PsalMR5_03579 [Piscirickettsia salmonis]